MFERFTPAARRVVVLAQEEARMLDHGHVGTEHLLLSILEQGSGSGAPLLMAHGVDLEGVRTAVVEIIGRGLIAPSGHIPFTPRARQALEQGLREALALESAVITEDHIALGVLRGTAGVARQVLQKLGAAPEDLASRLEEALAAAGAGEEESGDPVDEALGAFHRVLGQVPDVPHAVQKAAMAEALRAAGLASSGFTRAA